MQDTSSTSPRKWVYRLRFAVQALLTIATWILAVVTTLAGLAAYIDPEVWGAPAVLCLALPYFWCAALIFALAWWSICREKTLTLALILAMLIAMPSMTIVCPLNLPKAVPADTRTFKVMTFNAYYCRDLQNPDATYSRSLSDIIHSGADIVCLQEQYSINVAPTLGCATQAQLDSVMSIYPYQINNGNIDVILLSKYPVTVKHVAYPEQMNFFMYQSYEIDIKGLKLTLLNVHMPSYLLSKGEQTILVKTGNKSFINSFMEVKGSLLSKLVAAFAIRARAAQALADYARRTSGPLIICGDFNDVPASWTYRKVRSAGLRDAYVDAGFGPMITYNKNHLFFHIDQILYRGPLRPISIERGRLRSSDHYPVIARFAITRTDTTAAP